MNNSYGRDLDLNLLRVLVVVAETGSVTAAASRLYLTQPAVSAALKRLAVSVGGALFARDGRGLVLTARGERLVAKARPHLAALVDAALSPAAFDPRTSDRVVQLKLSDSSERWLLPPLLRAFERGAPRMRLVVQSVQFRTVAAAFAEQRVDLAVTVADEMPASVKRRRLFHGGFVCLFDPRHAKLGKRPTLARYLAHRHVVVSYNGDLRGVVEDLLGVTRDVRVSVPAFHLVGPVVDGTSLVATVPGRVAEDLREMHPRLRTAAVPFAMGGSPMELLSRAAVDDDPAIAFVRERIEEIAKAAGAKERD